MDNNRYKVYLKNQYLHKIRPLQSVNEVISQFKQRIDIIETELSESESVFLKMTSINYVNAYNIKPLQTTLDNLNFLSYEVVKNQKSEKYYNAMKKTVSDDQRILIIVESTLNEITSNCEELKVDMLIERGIDSSSINQETPDFFAYLMLFDTDKQN